MKRGASAITGSPLALFLRSCKSALVAVGLLSAVINLLVLTSSIYMLEVYDRAIPAGSIPTLIGLSVAALCLYGLQSIFDLIRQRIMGRIGTAFDLSVAPLAYALVSRMVVHPRLVRETESGDPLRDTETVRSFLGGLGPATFFDLPWLPVYLAVCFLFHLYLGVLALCGAILLWSLAWIAEVTARAPAKAAAKETIERANFAEAARRNAESVAAMGMRPHLVARFAGTLAERSPGRLTAGDRSSTLAIVSRTTRIVLQSALLGAGAFLVIEGQASSGIMIAASIMMGRALAPIEAAIAHWRPFLATRNAWRRLDHVLSALPEDKAPLTLPQPRRSLSVENLVVAAPGEAEAFVQGIGFRLEAGDALAVIGPSGSGKSTLVRALAGVWMPARGVVRLDGSAIDHFGEAGREKAIGYLSQSVDLFDGTITENIARFAPDPEPQAILAAAEAAGAHQLIATLPQGYATQIGRDGAKLSAGQRQRIGLARALYGDPFLVVLDEPNSNLDAEGEAALTQALLGIRRRGGIVVVVAHRPSVVAAIDKVLVMAQGRMRAFGPKTEIMPKVLVPAPDPSGLDRARPTMPPNDGKTGEARS